jgi:hypothetical protein
MGGTVQYSTQHAAPARSTQHINSPFHHPESFFHAQSWCVISHSRATLPHDLRRTGTSHARHGATQTTSYWSWQRAVQMSDDFETWNAGIPFPLEDVSFFSPTSILAIFPLLTSCPLDLLVFLLIVLSSCTVQYSSSGFMPYPWLASLPGGHSPNHTPRPLISSMPAAGAGSSLSMMI